jgi:hypothetical protein
MLLKTRKTYPEVQMKNFIGGLFNDRKNAELARKALLESGIEDTSINVLERTQENKETRAKREPSIQSIGVGALIGALLIGAIGTGIGLLVGLGVIHIPSLEPEGGATVPFQITWQFISTSIFTGLIFGAVTGIILGAAGRMFLWHYKQHDPKRINKDNVMVAVQTDDIRKETKAKLTMKEYGAKKFEEFRDTWDTDIWSVSRDNSLQTR